MANNVPLIDQFQHSEHFRMDPPCCFMCDEGGDVLFCDGPCERHFHYVGAAEDDGRGPTCTPITVADNDLDWRKRWFCELCKDGRAECFCCGLIGRMENPTTDETLVICCAHPDCYSYYHLGCLRTCLRVGDLPLNPHRGNRQCHPRALICPRHYCDVCKVYRPGIYDFIQCRRCPRAWCQDKEPGGNRHANKVLRTQKNWDFLKWRLVYCPHHIIHEGMECPDGRY
jgi:hypothetical protein